MGSWQARVFSHQVSEQQDWLEAEDRFIAVSKSNTGGWRLDVQGLRGLAVLAVVAYHSGLWLPGGYLGVDIFFVISGFVIASLLLREWQANSRISLKNFYVRRIKRLLPALLMVIAVTIPISLFVLSPFGASQNSIWTALASIFGAGNLAIQYLSGGYFGDDASVNSFLHTWSLGVEEQFYLAFPALVIIALSLKTRALSSMTIVRLAVMLVSLLSAGVLIASYLYELPFEALGIYGFYSPIGRIWEFGLGAMVATITRVASKSLALRLLGWSLVALALFLPLPSDQLGWPQLFAAVGTAALILAGQSQENTDFILGSRPMVFLGDISYSWYLWHWPLIVITSVATNSNWLIVLIAGIGSLLPSWISYKHLEMPLRHSSWNSKQVLSSVLPLASASALAILTSGFTVSQGFFNDELKNQQGQILADHAPAQRSWLCAIGTLDISNIETCTWEFEGDGKPIYLVGDSQAGMFAEAAIGAAKDLASDLVISTTAGCPLLIESAPNSECAGFTQRTLQLLSQASPGKVVISFAQQQNFNRELIREELVSSVRDLTSQGHEVYFIGPIPHFSGENVFNPLLCSLGEALTGNCRREISSLAGREQFEKLSSVLQEVAEETRSTYVSALELVCSDSSCSTAVNGDFLYKDPSHITVFASEKFASTLAKALRD